MQAAGALAGEGWMARLHGGGPRGPGEMFLAAAYQPCARPQRRPRRASTRWKPRPQPLGDETLRRGDAICRAALKRIAEPLMRLAQTAAQADGRQERANWNPITRARSKRRRAGWTGAAKLVLPAWMPMLETLETGEISDDFIDWFEIAREDGRDIDVGLERHWIDPTMPLAHEVLAPAHGALITSATLRDAGDDGERLAKRRSAHRRAASARSRRRRASFGSPFRYDAAVAHLHRQGRGAARCRRAGGGVCANCSWRRAAARSACSPPCARCARYRSAHRRSRWPMPGITLYAQHVDRLDTGALVDLFRAEENACLLGTDALRDGVDVPGRSLRLVVFDKVPWPKPTILHKARRARFGKGYDDLLTRFRLKQAFGRLIRGADDKGCFVILEGATPVAPADALSRRPRPSSAAAWPRRLGISVSFLAERAVTGRPAEQRPISAAMTATEENLFGKRRIRRRRAAMAAISTGILPSHVLKRLIARAARDRWPTEDFDDAQIQPASIDLRLGAGGLAGARQLPARAATPRCEDKLATVFMHEIDLTQWRGAGDRLRLYRAAAGTRGILRRGFPASPIPKARPAASTSSPA